MRAVIRRFIAPFLLILQRQVVTLAAPSALRPGAWSALGVRHAAVGQHHGIANGLDLLSSVTFPHVFQLNRRSYRCCY